MKITADKMIQHYNNILNTKKQGDKTAEKRAVGRNFDAVMIQSNSRQIEEKKFTESVSQGLITRLRTGTSEEKIENLRQKVAEGTYQVDAGVVASRILLQGEDMQHAGIR